MPRYGKCLNKAANMWENSLKNEESDKNKILYETLLDFFLQRNGTYCLNKPRITYSECACVALHNLREMRMCCIVAGRLYCIFSPHYLKKVTILGGKCYPM